jgi:hypothetical protein
MNGRSSAQFQKSNKDRFSFNLENVNNVDLIGNNNLSFEKLLYENINIENRNSLTQDISFQNRNSNISQYNNQLPPYNNIPNHHNHITGNPNINSINNQNYYNTHAPNNGFISSSSNNLGIEGSSLINLKIDEL